MPAAIRRCHDHGFFPGDRCPDCDARGESVLSGDRRRRLSKFTSGALRHFPDDAGIALDDAGWAVWDDLVRAVEGTYDWATEDHLAGVVATDPKGRFEVDGRDGERVVRAAYGHSVAVDLGRNDRPVPDVLYHGTAPRNVDAIEQDGLKPMHRQFVHLSGTRETAREVGRRHAGDPVVFRVDAAGLLADGHDVTKRGRETYTADRVPPEYLTREG